MILKCYVELYKRRMTHRDLKPQNILTLGKGKEMVMKISDFGAAMEQSQKRISNPHTKGYASPQQIRNREYTDKCDVYALGCIFFELLVGKTPREADCTNTVNNIMKMDKLRKKLKQKGVPAQMSQFIESCLREKESVEIEVDGRMVEDASRSRLGW